MDLSKPFRVVLVTSTTDPAIDADAMLERVKLAGTECKRVEAYLATRDATHLVFRPATVPTWYELRPIKARELNALVDDLRAPTGAELWAIVARCLVSIDGVTWAEGDRVTVDAMRGTTVLSEQGMERVAEVAGLGGVRELGDAVLRRAVPPASALAPFASQPG